MSFGVSFLIMVVITAVLFGAGWLILDQYPRAGAIFLVAVMLNFSLSVNYLIIKDVQKTTMDACAK